MSATPPAGISKICILVLGTIILILGCYSHFDSIWVKRISYGFGTIKPYQICDLPGAEKCPKISMERYFVSIVIITFILSVVSLVAQLTVQSKIQHFKLIDAGYHIVAAILLIIAAIVYLVSATQINNLAQGYLVKGYRHKEKLAAGSLAVFQAVLYGATALLIFKNNDVRQRN